MSRARDSIVYRVADALGGRPVRWATSASTVGDYEGRGRTLEVFLADAAEQRQLLRTLRPHRAELEDIAGGPVIVIFHTTRETWRIYREMASPLAVIRDALQRDLPFVRARLRPPLPEGVHVLDIGVGTRRFQVSWSTDGFFVSASREDETPVERPDLRLTSVESAVNATRWLVRTAAPVDVLPGPTQSPRTREAA